MTIAVIEAALAGVLIAVAAVEIAAITVGRSAGAGRLHPIATTARRLTPALVSTDRLRSRVLSAGLRQTADEIYSLKAGSALAAALLGLPLIGLTSIRPGVLLLVVLAGIAFVVPDLVLERKIARRRAQIAVELPDVLDLLAVGVGAGLPIAAALEQVAARHGGTLGAELGITQRAISAGSPRADALRALRGRCPHQGVAALVAAIDRSDRHGAQLAPAFGVIAADARRQRARAINERASRAAPQIQLVIALGLVPATMLMVAAALVASL